MKKFIILKLWKELFQPKTMTRFPKHYQAVTEKENEK